LSELTPDAYSNQSLDFSHDPVPDPSFQPPVSSDMPTVSTPRRWSFGTRLAFRYAFCYLLIYALGCGNATLWEVIPFHIGEHLNDWTSWPFFHAAQWLGDHYFHLTGVGAKLHGTGSGDTILNWIAVGVMLVVAILATLIWTALAELSSPGRRSLAYPRLFFWFRLTIRLTLGVAMINYGLAKLFPLQMSPPYLAVLNEPLGNTSPMTMLWTLIGLNPVYEMICGAAELSAGILILFRRTGLLGELLTAFLATNIVLYNFCFDVPVKLYAAHLVLMSIALIVPDMQSLLNFFFLHRPLQTHRRLGQARSALWSPPRNNLRRRGPPAGRSARGLSTPDNLRQATRERTQSPLVHGSMAPHFGDQALPHRRRRSALRHLFRAEWPGHVSLRR
jgi:hypothetical protein